MGLDMFLNRHKEWTKEGELAYWRKANQIHLWFVNNVQNGKDDCGTYPVTKDQLKKLIDTAIEVNKSIELISGTITNGYTAKAGGGFVANLEEGKIIKDPSVARELLPTQNGFFFGGTDYDEWYADDIENTISQLSKIYKTMPDSAYPIYYCASW